MRRYLLIILIILLALAACSRRDGRLKPLREAGEDDLLSAAQPQLVTFSELQADPESFHNRLIRVSGSLLKLPPAECLPYSGPTIEWALIAEELRLDATGFERVIGLLNDDSPMTVDGLFRLYEGPLGCGKGADDGSAWFLDVLRIVEPNPLVSDGRPRGSIGFGPVTPFVTSTPIIPVATPTAEQPPVATSTLPGIPTMTATSQLPSTVTVTPTSTLMATETATASPTLELTPTITPLPGTETPTPTPTATVEGYPGQPTPTATIEGYPGQPTPTATGVPTTYP